MTIKFYPKEHDILKLCDNYKGSKIHYCPHYIDNASLEQIKKVNGFRAIKHHCVFRSIPKRHCCDPREFYPITKEEFFLPIADVTASVISRKLNIGFRRVKQEQPRTKEARIIWDTYHIWVNKNINECKGRPPDDDTVLEGIIRSNNLSTVFEEKKEQIKRRSEDAWKCPFASLMTHSELTEKWFNYFLKNKDYFRVPDQINNISEASKIKPMIQGSNSKKHPSKGLSIYFIRLKLFANQSLSRIVDTEIIRRISDIVRTVPGHFSYSQELYTLYDEVVFVISDPKIDIENYIRVTLQNIEEFTTNYYFEGNFSEARLLNKELLRGYNQLFRTFQYTFYPKLKDKIDPKYDELGVGNEEAYHAKLCELCNMDEAIKTFWKFNDDEQMIHECLCNNCYQIRETQKAVNEAIKEGRDIPHGIGYKIAKWGDKENASKLCFIKIDLNLTILNDLLKNVLIDEFPLKKPTDKYNDENIGFSIIYEFLNHYNEFLISFKSRIAQIGKFEQDFVDEETNVSNEFEVLNNFICLRFDNISEARDVLSNYVKTYMKYFPQFSGLHDSKNKTVFPITFSSAISNIKFPFFEAWRYLNAHKTNMINIRVVRNYELNLNYREYQHLENLDLEGNRISNFLHRLVEIDQKTGSELLINTEIFNYRNFQGEIFQGIRNKYYDIAQLINYYKLVRK